MNTIGRETAIKHYEILEYALYQFNDAGGNLHVLIDEMNTSDEIINWLDKEWLPKQKESTSAAQWAVERAILNLIMQFNEKDRFHIISGYDG